GHFGCERDHTPLVTFENLLPHDLHRGVERELVARDGKQRQVSGTEPTDFCAEFRKWPISHGERGSGASDFLDGLACPGSIDVCWNYQRVAPIAKINLRISIKVADLRFAPLFLFSRPRHR